MATLDDAARLALELPQVVEAVRYGHGAELGEKEAVLAATGTLFTISHFNGYSAIPVQVDRVTQKALHDALVDGWLACAPDVLTKRYLGN